MYPHPVSLLSNKIKWIKKNLADAMQEAPVFPSCKAILQQADSTNKCTNNFIPKGKTNRIHVGYFIETDSGFPR